LLATFNELLCENWLVPVNDVSVDVPRCWYLPFFVTTAAKPRVVYDGASTVEGMSINQAVLAGENLLNNLVDVLIRFRLGRYACVADVSKCFFQVKIPEDQQDFFRIIWYQDNDLDNGKPQIFRFTRHVWGINSSPYIALLALKHLVLENPTNASRLTLNVIESCRYMDDILFASNSLSDLEIIAKESVDLFDSRGFKLRKWVSNSHAKSVLLHVRRCDLSPTVRELDLGSQPLPDSKTLGLVWNTECDTLRINFRVFREATSRRQMASQLASQFDPLGMASPFLLGGKLILQKVSASNADWDDALPMEVRERWAKWLSSLHMLNEFSIPRNCFEECESKNDVAVYQLHAFCDASDSAFSGVVYLRKIVAGGAQVAFVLGRSRLVLTHQANWVISRKELEAAKLCSGLVHQACVALSHLKCSVHLWTDSQVVLKWITNPDLHLNRFVKRRVDKILSLFSSEVWSYVHTSFNPADVGTREKACKIPDLIKLWLNGPEFLLVEQQDVVSPTPAPVVRMTVCGVDESDGLFKLIDIAHDLYALKKRLAYLVAFIDFVIAKARKGSFIKPVLDAAFLDHAFMRAIRYVQTQCFGPALKMLSNGSPDDYENFLKRLRSKAASAEQIRQINELKTLRNLRPCFGLDSLLRVEGRLENADLPTDTKNPIILPGRHPLTRLIALDEHCAAGHAGPSYTLMKVRQRFWVIHGVSSIRFYISDCGKCSIRKAKPIRQLMADLPSCRLTVCNKPFKYCGVDYLGPLMYRHSRSDCKAWGLLFTCLCTRCIHVEIVTSLDLNSFLLAFSRFTNLRGAVDVMYSDNGATFRAASDKLPNLLGSTQFNNSLRKRNIAWIRIPPYAPSQGGSWEAMVKLFKNALYQVLDNSRRKPSLIELQTFTLDAVRIVNDRPLTALSDQPNDLSPITPSSFLGQQLSPNTPLCEQHDKGDLRKDFLYNSTLAHRFWLGWMKSYLPSLQGRNKWRELQKNLVPGQLVLVGDSEDISCKGAYRLGRIHCLHPQLRKGKEVVRRATVAVLGRESAAGHREIEYVLRDLSKIAPV